MSPLNRGPLLGPRMPPIGMRPPPPRFGGRLPLPGMALRMPPPIGPMFGPMRQRMMPPRPGPPMMRPGGLPPLFGPRGRGVPPLMPPIMGPRAMGPRGPMIRPGPRGLLPPQGLPLMRPRFPIGNGSIKRKPMNNVTKSSKLEELELKKPWMTDEIRNEIQKKNKLYAKAKKNKDAKEWEEFKDLRNKVTRMIRDAKNEYLAINPEQAEIYEDDDEPYDQRDENYTSSEENACASLYCEVCDREFETPALYRKHVDTHKTCGIDGCIFSAHPKLVEKHIRMQHCTGLYHRMKNLSTPEDIEQWIVERKKKYPTKVNVERKQAEQTEKIERGEMIEKRESARGARKPAQEKRRRTRKRKYREAPTKPEVTVKPYRDSTPFAGTANSRKSLKEREDQPENENIEDTDFPDVKCDITDEEDEPSSTWETPLEKPEVPSRGENRSSLASLIADYASDSDDDEAPDEVPTKKIKMEIPSTVSRECESTTKPEASIVDAVPRVPSDNRKNRRGKKDWRKSSTRKHPSVSENNNDIKNRTPKRLMLLERLLSRSIQHERNVICQCVKYIADNNFFAG